MRSFLRAVLSGVTWRAVLVTQTLGVLFALTPWLEHWPHTPANTLQHGLIHEALAGAFLMFAAFAGDEAVRRGWMVRRAFIVVLLAASTATALAGWVIEPTLLFRDPYLELQHTVTAFFDVGAIWGMALLVYLNRQSAARLLSSVRGDELDRAQAERRLIASDIAAVEVQIDPAAVSRQLQMVRNLYAADDPSAENGLETLINDLRERVAQCARVP
ncbi:MAG TPA: hypothetical protein VGM97_16210 [Steroidobacteraceae bacterium]|jgi:hypothetical protein